MTLWSTSSFVTWNKIKKTYINWITRLKEMWTKRSKLNNNCKILLDIKRRRRNNHWIWRTDTKWSTKETRISWILIRVFMRSASRDQITCKSTTQSWTWSSKSQTPSDKWTKIWRLGSLVPARPLLIFIIHKTRWFSDIVILLRSVRKGKFSASSKLDSSSNCSISSTKAWELKSCKWSMSGYEKLLAPPRRTKSSGKQ